jgi:aminopeptidase N
MVFRILCCLLAILSSAFGQSVFPPRGDGEARTRTYDVLHYSITVSFDETRRSLVGRVATTLVPFLPDFRTVVFDAEQMEIYRVALAPQGQTLPFDVGPATLTVHLDRSYSFRDTLTLTVDYACTPKKGLFFTQPDSGYPAKPWQIWTQGEDMDNHFWFPCYDFPNDRATSEVTLTVKNTYAAVSNGRLVSVTENGSERTYHWQESKPHVSYLIMIAAGNYAVLRDSVDGLPLEYYVYPGREGDARVCFRQTPDMIRFFSRRIGISYPWEKYAQVLIADFTEGGMENTSAAALADEITLLDSRTRVDDSPVSLLAHELAHQWWGDLITCKDWRHLWLNESFASYFDPLYQEYYAGKDEFDYTMHNAQEAGISSDKTSGRKPIVSVGTYGANIYPRGAAVLHMLRFMLGDDLFWRAIRQYAVTCQFRTVETNDFKNAIEEATGQNLYWFFEQWVYRAGYPVFDVSYAWSDSARAIRLHVKQTQTLDSLTGVFRTPVDVEVASDSSPMTVRLDILNADSTYVIPSPAHPTYVVFDTGDWILKELHCSQSRESWTAQALTATHAVDRLAAVEALRALSDSEASLSVFSRIALHDPFWGVRREAVTALRMMSESDSTVRTSMKDALLKACKDTKPAVRAGAVRALGSFKGDDVVAALYEALRDSSYSVMASALGALPRAHASHATDTLDGYLRFPSYRDGVAIAALHALSGVDSTGALEHAFMNVRYGKHPFMRFTALHLLARHGRSDPRTEPVLLALLNDKNGFIAATAAQLLGDIGTEEAILPLESVAKGSPAAAAAQASLSRIRSRHHPGDL